MDNSFVWIIDENIQRSMVLRGVAAHYTISSAILKGHAPDVLHSRVWLITRGAPDVVTACLHPKKIEKFTDGLHTGDYLLTIDLRHSFKIVNRNTNWSHYSTDFFSKFQLGIANIPRELDLKLISLITDRIQTKIQSPAKSIKNLPFDKVPNKSHRILATMAVNEILKNFSLDDVWGSKLGLTLNPFANFGYALINETFGSKKANDALNYLNAIDPLQMHDNRKAVLEKEELNNIQQVDINFVQIDPDTIYTREFVPSKGSKLDIEAALEKTETAEKLHQEMLKDISTYLISRGIRPFESDSIDLMFEFNKSTFILEIKSTNGNNLIAQCAKGAFQLAYYGNAIKDDIEIPQLRLVIHKTDNQDQEEICLHVLTSLSTECLIYDPSEEWPNRLPGLLSH